MSRPSRQEIRARLRQAATQVDRAVTRVTRGFVPVGDGVGAPPDHTAYIKADHSLCCAWHEEYGFTATRWWS
jgi:hypothetical protein